MWRSPAPAARLRHDDHPFAVAARHLLVECLLNTDDLAGAEEQATRVRQMRTAKLGTAPYTVISRVQRPGSALLRWRALSGTLRRVGYYSPPTRGWGGCPRRERRTASGTAVRSGR